MSWVLILIQFVEVGVSVAVVRSSLAKVLLPNTVLNRGMIICHLLHASRLITRESSRWPTTDDLGVRVVFWETW